MKKLNVLAISAAVAGALLSVSGTATAGVTANVGATSNYLWRGTSLSNEAAAVYGGVDYAHDIGFYAGLWQSSEGLSGSAETDLYAGFSGEAGDFTYDAGYLQYTYLQSDPSADFSEIYLSGGWKFVELFYANSRDLELGTGEGSDYISVTLTYDRFSFVYGDYGFDDSSNDYSHFDLGVALTDELSLTYSKNDANGVEGDGRFVVAYTLEFDVK